MRTVSIPREQIFQGPLVLVNRAHPLHEKERSALTSVDPHHPDILLESRARQLLSACIQKAGGQREIVPVSGWRSQQEQQRIWDDSMAEHGETFTRQYVALPGCSEHQTGLAIDLGKAAGYSISSVWAGTVTMDWFPRSRCFGPFTTAFLHCAAIPAMACSSRHCSFCLGPPEGGGTKSCLWRASSSLWQP